MKLYTANVVADWLAVTPRWVRQLRDEGVLPERSPGLFELRATVVRYILYLRRGGKADLNDERALLTRAKREATEMENALRRGELHRTEDIEQGIKTLCLNTRSRFLTLPAKLAGELAQMDGDRARIFDKLKVAIEETLEELSSCDIARMMEEEGEMDDGPEESAGRRNGPADGSDV